ncbi:MAG: hypothetical protein ABDI07_00230 [Candidatus Kryptonium sp.]
MTKFIHLTFQAVKEEAMRCPRCGSEMLFIRRCCGDNEVWRCEKCEYVERESNQNIWYYYIWAK